MTQKSSIVVFILLIPILLFGFVFFSSSRLPDLEKNIIVKSDIKVTSIEKHPFGNGGLVLIGLDNSGDGILRAYTKFPVINRYMKTKAFSFTSKDDSVLFAGESWAGYQALTYKDGKLMEESKASGNGFAGRIPLWVTLSALSSFLITYGPNYLRKRKQKVKDSKSNS